MASSSKPADFNHPYAPQGLFGLMVPYGNFATEWELSVLLPKPAFFITTRLTDDSGDLTARLQSYFDPDRLSHALSSFGTTPLRALGIACSATSYFIGKQQEDALFQRLSAQHGTPFISTTAAMKSGLDALGTKRIELISPYPAAITEKCVQYWSGLGYAIDAVCQLSNPNPGFHPIYTLTPDQIEHDFLEAIQRARAPVLITGTGLSSLPAVRKAFETLGTGAPPILSATLCLARALLLASTDGPNPAEQWFTSQAPWMNSGAFTALPPEKTVSD